MTATGKNPNPYETQFGDYGRSIILVPLILGGAVVISLILLWRIHDRNVQMERMARCEESARTLLRAAYLDMRALQPEAALEKTTEARREIESLRSLRKFWPADYAEMRVALLLMEAEALLMLDNAANASVAEENFSKSLGLMAYSSGELWQFGLLGRAQARYELGNYAGAIADLDQVMTRNPNFGAAYYWRALAKQKAGDEAGAHEDEERARNLDSWPPLRHFMQISGDYSRDILFKSENAR